MQKTKKRQCYINNLETTSRTVDDEQPVKQYLIHLWLQQGHVFIFLL
jgi:hypothetical protein